MEAGLGHSMRRRRIYESLTRVTSGQQLIPVIDGLRFVAITAVIMCHLMGYFIAKSSVHFSDAWPNRWLVSTLNRGWFGVDLFFVISGFVISLPFAGHQLEGRPAVALSNYYLRRLTRLEPPFIICVTILFALLVVVKGQAFSDALPHYLATATYSHNIVYGRFSTLNPVTWSLEVEIQFYLMAPLIALVFAVKRLRARRALIVGLIAAASALQPALENIRVINVFDFAQFFLTGFLLADVYISTWRRTPATSLVMDIAGLGALTALYIATGSHDKVDHNPLWIVCSCTGLFVVCCAAFRGRITSRCLGNPWIVVIGGMCYTIYLYHYQIFSLIGHMAMRAQISGAPLISFGIAIVLMVPVMLVVSSVLFVLFEKPFMRKDWPHRLAAWTWSRRDLRRDII